MTHYLLNSRIAVNVAYMVSKIIPETLKLNKYINYIGVQYSVCNKHIKLNTLPHSIRIAPISICNYRCTFCEIHKDNILYPDRSRNAFTLNNLKNYEGILRKAITVNFFGGSEEPLLAKDFAKMCLYLKDKYSLRLMVNTNASMIKGDLLKDLVRSKFDLILISYHAGEKSSYKRLMTGDVGKIDKNIFNLNLYKNKCNQKLPVIAFNYALHKDNMDQYEYIIDKAEKLKVSSIYINRYHGGRNKLDDKKVSFEYDVDLGNKVLDDIYQYASNKKVSLIPATPRYWTNNVNAFDDNDINYDKICKSPWSSIHFNPVLDSKDSHYVGVCNRIELLKINYDKFLLNDDRPAKILWNHHVLLYLRETVNGGSNKINPICKLCKNNGLKFIRNRYPDDYANKRDTAVMEFFEKFNKLYPSLDDCDGLTVLSENPHSDKKYIKIVNSK